MGEKLLLARKHAGQQERPAFVRPPRERAADTFRTPVEQFRISTHGVRDEQRHEIELLLAEHAVEFRAQHIQLVVEERG